jgi:hypothetical protein
MGFRREIVPQLFSSVGVIVLLFTFYALLQNNTIYRHSLGLVAGNYRNANNQITKSHIPYEKFEQSKMYSWDANLYRQIKDNGYNIKSAGGDYIFAFFPLFPFLWRISGLSAISISLFNYLLYVISLIILVSFLPQRKPKFKPEYFLILLGIPMLVVYLIPYSEGLFMITTTIAMWGLYKNRYGIYFIAALLSSMTRSSVTIMTLAIVFTEFYFFLQHRNCIFAIRSFGLKCAPLFTGTALVTFIQYLYGSNHFAKFIEVEKYWGYSFRIPGQLTDWAHEQFCTNLPLTLIVLPTLLAFLTYTAWQNVHKKKSLNLMRNEVSCEYNREYIYILSVIYITGIILTILLLRGGSLNGLSRYVFCTPFYVILLFLVREKTTHANCKTVIFLFSTAAMLAILLLSLVNYSKHWNFSDLGVVIFYFQISFFTFANLISNRWIIAAFIVVSTLWASYLLNMFVSNAWIIT